jgi:hypothetical protein
MKKISDNITAVRTAPEIVRIIISVLDSLVMFFASSIYIIAVFETET